ncbi:MAG: phosphoribosylformylglycinamidine synthase subunit PurQ, partial [Eubacteriales bacterium]|nr:phosphoribosylformylglycinamidine synthase subunit PurQ [Eubacteriales bacterium]
RMKWRGRYVADISRDFLDTNGAVQHAEAFIRSPSFSSGAGIFSIKEDEAFDAQKLKQDWEKNLCGLHACSRKGLGERFDSTIGAGTILMPYGGKYQMSPSEGMAACLPMTGTVSTGTATLISFGFDPHICSWSPFHGAVYSITEAVAKIAAMGGDYTRIRLSLQEYFEKLGKEPARWGKPLSAMLGALYAQRELMIPSIGGKDSMSGTFNDLDVPPSLIAFAVAPVEAENVIRSDFVKPGNKVILILQEYDRDRLPVFACMHENYAAVRELAERGDILSACSVRSGGIAAAVSRMCFGNMLGFDFADAGNSAASIKAGMLFKPVYGSILIEVSPDNAEKITGKNDSWNILGTIRSEPFINIDLRDVSQEGDKRCGRQAECISIDLKHLAGLWTGPLEGIFPSREARSESPGNVLLPDKSDKAGQPGQTDIKKTAKTSGKRYAAPRVFMPVFPGTNCEYDTRRKFEEAGALVDEFVIKNLSREEIEESISAMANAINNAQIIMLPGGFSGGDEPEGSGKFIAAVFRNPYIEEAVTGLLQSRDGLILGICNGFQALVKLGLLPWGRIAGINEKSPTLTFNTIGRHISAVVSTRIEKTDSPWLMYCQTGDIHSVAISHGEGRFIASPELIFNLREGRQIAARYVGMDGKPSMDPIYNPNGSYDSIEGITSPDGRILGKMGHSERTGPYLMKNVPGNYDQKIFRAGTDYFRL